MNDWLGRLFDRENVDGTVAALVASQGESGGGPSEQARLKQKLADVESRLSKFHAAIEAGVDPAAMVDAINSAQNERAALRAELEHAPTPSTLTDAEIHAMIDSFGDVGSALSQGTPPEGLVSLYAAVDLHVHYQHEDRAADIEIHPARSRVNSLRVRGRSCALTTRIELPEVG
ncbi:hypothetical protein INP57_24025 [Saccharopolyspora sp. HNM0986]|uniref:hypothetical protein n=1 Tax=Saccharopolyspora galaxeae TaxID=2781241 RepID=UPI00190C9B25|nr:hypothetical protein [Saccharopolyspora sp. HNM0986]MBK0869887.1 hypothetical protein [Saccharopolyspora sp. HNM0986]